MCDDGMVSSMPKSSPAAAPAVPDKEASASAPLRCQYFVPRKKRNCRMLVRPGKRFCGEHAASDDVVGDQEQKGEGEGGNSRERIPCPYDPKHTCDKARVEKHLKKCRSKPQDLPEYCRPGANLSQGMGTETGTRSLTVATASDERLLEVIGKVEAAYDKLGASEQIRERILDHPALLEATSAPGLGPAGLKHLKQNASLLGNLEKAGLLKRSSIFVEFGSGRGQLTFWLAKALKDVAGEAADVGKEANTGEKCDFVLVDRASHRHKFDNRLRDDPDLSVDRVRADIQDLVLAKVTKIKEAPLARQLVGVSKHLCGAATDLALLALRHRELARERVSGIMVALCCHHRCTWDLFVGKRLLSECGLGREEDFGLLCGLTSWATCGSGRPRENKKGEEAETTRKTPAQADPKLDGRYDRLSLPRERREEVGRKTKRVLDLARLDHVKTEFPALAAGARLWYYCESDVSLENVMLLANKS